MGLSMKVVFILIYELRKESTHSQLNTWKVMLDDLCGLRDLGRFQRCKQFIKAGRKENEQEITAGN